MRNFRFKSLTVIFTSYRIPRVCSIPQLLWLEAYLKFSFDLFNYNANENIFCSPKQFRRCKHSQILLKKSMESLLPPHPNPLNKKKRETKNITNSFKSFVVVLYVAEEFPRSFCFLEQPEAFLDFITLPGRDAVKVGACHLENGFKLSVRQVTLEKRKWEKRFSLKDQ